MHIYIDDLFFICFSNIYCCMVYLYWCSIFIGMFFFGFFSYDEWRRTSLGKERRLRQGKGELGHMPRPVGSEARSDMI